MAASMVIVAIMPRVLMAPRMARIFQRPSGVVSWMRAPPVERAYRRVICVETPLSSRKINRSRSILPIVSTNSSRRLRFSSVSRSWAWSDFFLAGSRVASPLATNVAC